MSAAAENPANDEHLLATLEEDERQALADHAEDLKAMAAEKKAAETEDDDEDDDDAPAAAVVAAPAPPTDAAAPADAPAPAADAPAAAPTPAAQVEEDDDEGLPPPAYSFKLPDDFDAKVKALDEREAAAYQRLEDGEIDQAGLRSELRQINEERRPLDRIQLKAEVAEDMHQQELVRVTKQAADKVIAQGAKDGVDYKADQGKWDDLREFASAIEARNPDKSPAWVLGEAHKRVLSLHNITPAAAPAPSPAPAPAPTPTPPAASKAAALAARKPDLTDAPRTLAQVPGGDGPGDVQAEFSDILALSGEAYEDAIARLTPAQRQRFEQVA